MNRGKKFRGKRKAKETSQENTNKDPDKSVADKTAKFIDDTKQPRLNHKPFEDKSRMPLRSDESANGDFEIDGQ